MNVFTKHKIKLTPNKEIDAESFVLNNVKPKIYKINNDDKRNLFIYIFKKVEDRQEYGEPQSSYRMDIFPNTSYHAYQSWNVIIVDTLKQPKNFTDIFKIEKQGIEQMVFKDLNKGEVRQYKGESGHWKVTYTLKYYDHSFVNKKGMYIPDKYGDGQFNIHYKPTDYSNVQNLKIEYDFGSSGGSLSGENLNKGNILVSKHNIDDPKSVPTVTIRWNDQVEMINFDTK